MPKRLEVASKLNFVRQMLPPVRRWKLDTLGYARFRHWQLYAEGGLARQPVAVWLGNDGLSVEYGGQTLSSYDVSLSEDTKLREVTNPRLFVTRYRTPQLRLFGLDELGEDGWLKALELDEYAARSQNGLESIQGVLFSCLEAL